MSDPDNKKDWKPTDGQRCRSLLHRQYWLQSLVKARFPYSVLDVAHVLCEYVNSKTGICNPYRQTISRETGMKPANVSRAISLLKRDGVLIVSRSRRRNSYDLIYREGINVMKKTTPSTPKKLSTDSASNGRDNSATGIRASDTQIGISLGDTSEVSELVIPHKVVNPGILTRRKQTRDSLEYASTPAKADDEAGADLGSGRAMTLPGAKLEARRTDRGTEHGMRPVGDVLDAVVKSNDQRIDDWMPTKEQEGYFFNFLKKKTTKDFSSEVRRFKSHNKKTKAQPDSLGDHWYKWVEQIVRYEANREQAKALKEERPAMIDGTREIVRKANEEPCWKKFGSKGLDPLDDPRLFVRRGCSSFGGCLCSAEARQAIVDKLEASTPPAQSPPKKQERSVGPPKRRSKRVWLG